MEDAYQKCGWNVHIFTNSGISDHEGLANFHSDQDFANLEWGGNIVGAPSDDVSNGNVQLIRLSTLINDLVAKR